MRLLRRVGGLSLAVLVLWIIPSTVNAQGILLWNNAGGFTPANSCTQVFKNEIPLGIVESAKNNLQVIARPDSGAGAREIADYVVSVDGNYWETQMHGAQYAALICPGRKVYYLFNVFSASSSTAVAQVGVSVTDTDIFRGARVLSAQQAATDASNKVAVPQLNSPAVGSPLDVPTIEGGLDYVACTGATVLAVRDTTLNKIIFYARNAEPAKLVQSFGVDTQSKENAQYIKVQFPGHSGQNVGWVDAREVQVQSECAFTPPRQEIPVDLQAMAKPLVGLSDPDCCQFPVNYRPIVDYKTLERRFGAARTGRLHAACDLYRVEGEPVVSVWPGVVLRNQYPFYEGVDAIEVRHSGGFVVRYGEVMHTKVVNAIKAGAQVNQGEVIGYVGKVDSGCCTPMLHFELYSGAGSGSLTTSKQPYDRRSDLLDPSDYLTNWEQFEFGSSW